jgi:hypothetical protein
VLWNLKRKVRENLKSSLLQGLFSFFLGSDASGIGVAVNFRIHTSGVKHMQRVTKLIINISWLFPKKN